MTAQQISIYLFRCSIKGSPYLERIDDLIGRLHASGFIMLWRGLLVNQIGLNNPDSRHNETVTDARKTLKAEHLFIVFVLWLFGIVSGCFLFLCEIGFY